MCCTRSCRVPNAVNGRGRGLVRMDVVVSRNNATPRIALIDFQFKFKLQCAIDVGVNQFVSVQIVRFVELSK